jgi:hypothetical protein
MMHWRNRSPQRVLNCLLGRTNRSRKQSDSGNKLVKASSRTFGIAPEDGRITRVAMSLMGSTESSGAYGEGKTTTASLADEIAAPPHPHQGSRRVVTGRRATCKAARRRLRRPRDPAPAASTTAGRRWGQMCSIARHTPSF